MKEINIHPKILQAMRLSGKESLILDVLLRSKNINGLYSSKISKLTALNKKTVGRILIDLEKAGVAHRVFFTKNIRPRWKFKKGLEVFGNGARRRHCFRDAMAICAKEEMGLGG